MFVSVPGDVNGDGVPDVYASDYTNAAKGASTGRIYVHSGRDGRRLLTLTGEGAGEGFGIGPGAAGDVDFRIFEPDRPAPARLVADAAGRSEHGHLGAILEADARWQAGHPAGDPGLLLLDEAQALGGGGPVRQHQLAAAGPQVEFQQHPPGPFRPAQRQWDRPAGHDDLAGQPFVQGEQICCRDHGDSVI